MKNLQIIRNSILAIKNDNYPNQKIAIVLAMEDRVGEVAKERAEAIRKEFKDSFFKLYIAFHPGNIEGELKGKGANQAWALKHFKQDVIDFEKWNYENIIVSVFDIDTVIASGYFYRLTYKFLSTPDPYKASYQPVPVYHNNVWEAPFFARVAATSNTFWQMMQQIRRESLATYSSHSMSFKALADIGFGPLPWLVKIHVFFGIAYYITKEITE